jgi:uroporphyrinogen-III synthase
VSPPRRPLAGRTVVVTRARSQAGELVRPLERLGARVLVAPAIEIVPSRSAAFARALDRLADGTYDWVAVTSPRTVEVLAGRVAPRDVRARAAVIGEGTADAFRSWARRDPDLMPRTFTTAALARAFPRGDGRVLSARADIATDELDDGLRRKGWAVDRVDAYRTRFPRSLPADVRAALRAGDVDAVMFTSASTVRGFVRALGAVKGNPRVVCIGPVTAREARAHGLRVSAVADPHTVAGVVGAVERALARGRMA